MPVSAVSMPTLSRSEKAALTRAKKRRAQALALAPVGVVQATATAAARAADARAWLEQADLRAVLERGEGEVPELMALVFPGQEPQEQYLAPLGLAAGRRLLFRNGRAVHELIPATEQAEESMHLRRLLSQAHEVGPREVWAVRAEDAEGNEAVALLAGNLEALRRVVPDEYTLTRWNQAAIDVSGCFRALQVEKV